MHSQKLEALQTHRILSNNPNLDIPRTLACDKCHLKTVTEQSGSIAKEGAVSGYIGRRNMYIYSRHCGMAGISHLLSRYISILVDRWAHRARTWDAGYKIDSSQAFLTRTFKHSCFAMCLELPQCRSYSFHWGDKICEFHSKWVNETDLEYLVEASGWRIKEIHCGHYDGGGMVFAGCDYSGLLRIRSEGL